MTCYQSTNLPSGFTTTGRTSYKTESDCLNACKEGACCEGTTCTVKPQCQCQGAGKVFKGVGTTCAANTCTACYGCMAQHPTYMTVTFSQTAPISGGYHESLIDLSGSYSVPSINMGTINIDLGCMFCGQFTKTYANAVVNQFGTFNLVVSFRIIAAFWNKSKSIGIAMYGANMNAADTEDRRAGLYQFSVSTGESIGILSGACEIIDTGQLQSFSSCEGNSYQAVRNGWTTAAPLYGSQYRITLNQNAVACGSFSWAKA